MILLDTDVVIDVARNYQPALEWFRTVDPDELLALSGFTAMEIVQGSRNRTDQRRMLRILSRFRILWLTPQECEQALQLFTQFRLSHGAGILDTLVGYTAIANDLPIITFNMKHFGFLPNIQIMQPYRRI